VEEDAQSCLAASKVAEGTLSQVHETVEALKADGPRSRAALMARHDPADRWYPGLGTMLGMVQTREKRRYLPADRRNIFGQIPLLTS
jgi:hypothetical protein